MKFNIVVEIDELDIVEAMGDNTMNKQEVCNQITNNLYLGLSCIDAMLHRTLGIEGTNSYVERRKEIYE